VAEDPGVRGEGEAALNGLLSRYGDRLTPAMREELSEAVSGVVKTVTALRSVPLANGEAPLSPLVPYRGEE
jgi:hypothetical protein